MNKENILYNFWYIYENNGIKEAMDYLETNKYYDNEINDNEINDNEINDNEINDLNNILKNLNVTEKKNDNI